jgi:cytochrome b subunit of formate dehydrogenase
VLARGKRMTHDWVRIIYLWVIGLTLGGMLLHNSLIMFRQSRQHYHAHLAEPAVRRMTTNEVWQHLVLAVSFIGLAITGLALRFPDAWWVEILRAGGMSEEVRRWLHRGFAVAMVGVSVWHIAYMVATGRGRTLLRAMLPRPSDVGEAIHNVLYHAGLRRRPPVFRRFDYTQKAEYWALIWGTMVMTVTGFVLMFPELTTGWLPAWMIRVAEAIHFWEAILAVGAIVIWHFFFTIFLPREYPMSWTWVSGRMPVEQWRHHHGREVEETGVVPEVLPGEGRPTDAH